MQIDCASSFALCVDKQFRIWIFGFIPVARRTYDEEIKPRIFCDIIAKEVACGENHALICDYEGNTYSFGENSNGKLGFRTTSKFVQVPTIIQQLPSINHVSCGTNFSFCVSEEGKAYGFGLNSSGELGTSDLGAINEPKEVLFPKKIEKIACGEYHTLILTTDNKVYSCGLNTEGQLGLGDWDDKTEPTLVKSLNNVKSIACGAYFSVFLLENGSVYVCGYNYNLIITIETDQTGRKMHVNTPTQVSGLPTITSIYCGPKHTLCIDNEEHLWGFGANYRYQLTTEDDVHFLVKAEKIWTKISSIEIVSSGKSNSTMVVSREGISAFGHNFIDSNQSSDKILFPKDITDEIMKWGGSAKKSARK